VCVIGYCSQQEVCMHAQLVEVASRLLLYLFVPVPAYALFTNNCLQYTVSTYRYVVPVLGDATVLEVLQAAGTYTSTWCWHHPFSLLILSCWCYFRNLLKISEYIIITKKPLPRLKGRVGLLQHALPLRSQSSSLFICILHRQNIMLSSGPCLLRVLSLFVYFNSNTTLNVE